MSNNLPKQFGPPTTKSIVRGFVLLMVLVAVVLMSLSAYSFSLLMLSEHEASILTGRRLQSRLLVESGAESVRMFLAQGKSAIRQSGGVFTNPDRFHGILVRKDQEVAPETTGSFSIIAPGLDDATGHYSSFRYGLVDESSKLNLNVLPKLEELQPGSGKNLLMALPDMTEEVAEAILDWLDTDDEVRPLGAESPYYQSQDPPYLAKNGPLSSVEELLRVRGVTPELLFGNDVNQNGVLDPEEEKAQISVSGNPDALLGWANFLTIYSQEANRNWEGQKRININSDDLVQLEQDLSSVFSSEWVNFILAYRINGPSTETVPEDPDENGPLTGEIELEDVEPQHKFNQILDIVDAVTTVEFIDSVEETILGSPASSSKLESFGSSIAVMMENLTTVDADTIPGRINIMQAPRTILLGIPGLTEEQVDLIIEKREYEINDDANVFTLHKRYETWLLLELIVDINTMKTLLPFICAKGDVYRAEIIGYFENGEATSRAEVVYDTTVPLPRLLLWRDKSHLPLGNSAQRYGVAEISDDVQ